MKPKIEKGIPIPAAIPKQENWDALLSEMQPGDSVLLPSKHAIKFAQTVVHNHRQYKIVTRREGEGTHRCWLTKRAPKP